MIYSSGMLATAGSGIDMGSLNHSAVESFYVALEPDSESASAHQSECPRRGRSLDRCQEYGLQGATAQSYPLFSQASYSALRWRKL